MRLDKEFLERFTEENIAVNCETEEEAKEFCKWMHKNGLKWGSRDSYLELTNWIKYQSSTCYVGTGRYDKCIFFIQSGYEIIKYRELISTPMSLNDYQRTLTLQVVIPLLQRL